MSNENVKRIPWTIGEIIHLAHMENGSSKVYLLPESEYQDHTSICMQTEGHMKIAIEDSTVAAIEKISGQWKLVEHIRGERPDQAMVWSLFHRCWGNAASASVYEKSDWNALAAVLRRSGYEV